MSRGLQRVIEAGTGSYMDRIGFQIAQRLAAAAVILEAKSLVGVPFMDIVVVD